MALEIERKFLVVSDDWRVQVERSADYRQAYLAHNGLVSVRIRIAGDKANINLKSAGLEIQRDEFEYAIPIDDARQLLHLCSGAVIDKTRHFVRHERHLWEIDVFAGANAGLIIAEIELDSAEESFDRPQWLGIEVSGDPRYYNVYLADHPYAEWSVKPDPAST
ncbi:MAG: CYTH domain-containing protein [Gammaproteobacteria bacterium]|nr:CYTH domain-containing protein [Gammaproteobacteria bacterium]